MFFKSNDSVEICKKRSLGVYFEAVVVDSIGTDKYLVFYDNHSTKDGWFPVATVDSDEVRPAPPQSCYTNNNNFFESDRVDVYVGRAWRVGTVTRKFDSHYDVKLDCNGMEARCEFYELRPHLEWRQSKGWIYPETGSQSNQENTSAQGHHPAIDGNHAKADYLGGQANVDDLRGQPKIERPTKCRRLE